MDSPKKNPCPDCRFCQFCSDARCAACRPGSKKNAHMAIAEQIRMFDERNPPCGHPDMPIYYVKAPKKDPR